jgi:hypothetical protein
VTFQWYVIIFDNPSDHNNTLEKKKKPAVLFSRQNKDLEAKRSYANTDNTG